MHVCSQAEPFWAPLCWHRYTCLHMDVSNHCHIWHHWHIRYMCDLSGITGYEHVSSQMWRSWEASNVRMKFLNVIVYVNICVHTWDISKHYYMSALAYIFKCMTLVRTNVCLSESIWSNMIYFCKPSCFISEHIFIHRCVFLNISEHMFIHRFLCMTLVNTVTYWYGHECICIWHI